MNGSSPSGDSRYNGTASRAGANDETPQTVPQYFGTNIDDIASKLEHLL
jgi:hypothetical protein